MRKHLPKGPSLFLALFVALTVNSAHAQDKKAVRPKTPAATTPSPNPFKNPMSQPIPPAAQTYTSERQAVPTKR